MEKKTKIKTNVTVQIPRVPNFLIGEDNKPIPIGKLPEWALKSIAKQWTKNLINLARERRKNS